MSHFAEIKDGIVVRVIVADSQEWCEQRLGGQWVQTSYNTQGGEHKLGGKPLRINYAGIGYTYDKARDAFVPPKPSKDATLDEKTCQWKEPKTPDVGIIGNVSR